MLKNDMDVNAGAYQDGTPMEELGQQMLDLTVNVAAGERSVGEKAGHSQVSVWRNWKQTGPRQSRGGCSPPTFQPGQPIPIQLGIPRSEHTFSAIQDPKRLPQRSDRVGAADKSLLRSDCPDDC